MNCVKQFNLNVFVITYSYDPTFVDTLDAVSISLLHCCVL